MKRKLQMTCHGSNCGNAENLSKFISENKNSILKKENPVLLFPCGNLTDDYLSTFLSTQEVNVDKVVCYETTSRNVEELNLHLKSMLKGDDDYFDFVVFFSPSGVQSAKDFFLKKDENFERTKFVALGQKTSIEMENVGIKVDQICRQPNASSLIEAIKMFQ